MKFNDLNLLLKIIEEKSLDFIGFEYELTKEKWNPSVSPQKLEVLVRGNGLQLLENYHYNNGPCWYIFKKSLLEELIFEDDRLCEIVYLQYN